MITPHVSGRTTPYILFSCCCHSLGGRRRVLSSGHSLLQTTQSGRVVSSRAENDDWTAMLGAMGDHRSSVCIVLMRRLLPLLESNSQITCICHRRRVAFVQLQKSAKAVFSPTREFSTLIVSNTGSNTLPPPFLVHVRSLSSNSISLVHQTSVDGLLFCCRRFLTPHLFSGGSGVYILWGQWGGHNCIWGRHE